MFQFGSFKLDAPERRLVRDGVEIPLPHKVFTTLHLLLENAGRLLTRERLLDEVWPDVAVEEGNLNHNISILRKALGEQATGESYIETVPRVGYRFVAPVIKTTARPLGASGSESQRSRQQIRFCLTRDGVKIAYATTGAGHPLVKSANWLNHLDFEWDSPVWRHWVRELGKHHTIVRYDERANGLSDWDVEDVSFEAWVQDLEAVVPENLTPEHRLWFNDLQRMSASGENAARIMAACDDIHVRELLPSVSVPTIVFHSDRDQAVPIAEGRILAAEIPNARFVPLPSANHILLEGEPAWGKFLGALAEFLEWGS